jgi:hypothetical protein
LQLKELLNLKQQQASIVEAQAALERADESVRQGRAIMAFTMVTIFFVSSCLPLYSCQKPQCRRKKKELI